MVMGFTAFILTEESRKVLLETYPPKFSNIIADHITHEFNIDSPHLPMPPRYVKAVGYIYDDSLDAIIIQVDGGLDRPDSNIYHVTLSLEPYRSRKETNDLWNKSNVYIKWIEGPLLKVIPKFVEFKNEKEITKET